MVWIQIGFIAAGFLSGSVLYSRYLPWLLKRIDIVKVSEDHNPGTANVMKYAGVPMGICCLLCDMAKGFLPVYFAGAFCRSDEILFAFIMAAPVAGHAYSMFHRGKGGKAIAVTFGTFLGLWPDLQMVLTLCLFYLLFSLAVVIRHHEKRTVITFACFALITVVRTLMGRIPFPVCLGGMTDTAVVIHKNYADAHIEPVPLPAGAPAMHSEIIKEKEV